MLGALPLNRRVRTPLRLALSMQYFNTAISFKYSWRLLPIGPWSFGPPTKRIVRTSWANAGESTITNAQQDGRNPFDMVTSLRRKCQQNITGDSILKSDISGADKDHPLRNGRPAGADRTAFCSNAVHGLEFLGGIELPKRAAIHRRHGAEHPIHSAGKEHARDNADRRNNATMRRHRFRSLERSEPLFHAGRQLQGDQTIPE